MTFLGGEEGGTHKSSMIFVEHALMIQTPTPRPNSRVQRAQFFTLDSCPPEDTWYGVIQWVLRVLGQTAILTSPNEGETAVSGYNPALF